MFTLLKLINPVWYFNLKPSKEYGYFPSPEVVKELSPDLKPDPAFSPDAAMLEMSYRAHRLGCIDRLGRPGLAWWDHEPVSLTDEYRFARKHFHISRIFLALFCRLLMFNNPFKEFAAFFNSKSVNRFRFGNSVTQNPEYTNFTSELLLSQPQITVVIPTLNRYEYLKDVLNDLEKQDYKKFDVIVVDQSNPFQPEFYKNYKLNLKLIRQEQRALWLARNTAVKQSSADYFLFYDDDSRVGPDWIAQHLKCLDYFKGDISSGVSFSVSGGEVPADYSFPKWSDQLDTGNVLIKRNVFKAVGLFDTQFERQRMGDGEFGLRCYLRGYKNISNPFASRIHLKVGEGGLREMGSWDAFRPKKFWSPRPIPSVLYLYRKYFGLQAAILSLIINVPPSVIPYRFKKNKKLLLFGALFSILLAPFIFIQVFFSWMISGRMLKKTQVEMLVL